MLRPEHVGRGGRGAGAMASQPHLTQEGDGLLPHGLCIPDVGANDLSEGLLYPLRGRGHRQ